MDLNMKKFILRNRRGDRGEGGKPVHPKCRSIPCKNQEL
jgi:hypothetical protein